MDATHIAGYGGFDFFKLQKDGRNFIVGVEDWDKGDEFHHYAASIIEGDSIPHGFMGFNPVHHRYNQKEEILPLPALGEELLALHFADGKVHLDKSGSTDSRD